MVYALERELYLGSTFAVFIEFRRKRCQSRTCVARMESHVQRPTAESTVTTRPDPKDSWIAVADHIPARTQPLSRWRTLFSCSVPSIRLGAHAKLKARLEMLQPELVWPAASTFGNILSRAGLTSPQKKRKRITPCSEPFSTVTGPNQLWCMDFKGYFVTGDGKRCDPFTITDAYSRYLIRCQIVSRIDLSQVRAICEAAMREYGMPARIRTDNGAVRGYGAHGTFRNSRSAG